MSIAGVCPAPVVEFVVSSLDSLTGAPTWEVSIMSEVINGASVMVSGAVWIKE
jgi:hypothetical protein